MTKTRQRQLLHQMGIEVWTLRATTSAEHIATPQSAPIDTRKGPRSEEHLGRVVALCVPGTVLMLEPDDRSGTKRLAEDVLRAASGEDQQPYKLLTFDAAELQAAGTEDTNRAFTSFAKKCLSEHEAQLLLVTPGLRALIPASTELRTVQLPAFARLAGDAATKRALWLQLSVA